MRKKIHPQYGSAMITCACGNKIKTASTVKNMRIEVCSMCHPAFTGKSKFVDVAGRVDKFKVRQEKAAKMEADKETMKKAKVKDKAKDKTKAKAKTKIKIKIKIKSKAKIKKTAAIRKSEALKSKKKAVLTKKKNKAKK